MAFLAPLAFLGGLLAIPILLLYMLRLRRQEVVVSSNFLWQQVLRDREANTPWQRLRRNWLLILQLLILALLVLALARPAQEVFTISAGRTVILLDASASMNATDGENDRTRFEQAQREANLLLNELGAADQALIMRVAETSEPLTAYTSDINELRRAINDAQPGSSSADWETALTLAAAGAEGAESFRILIVSDGGIDQDAQLPENIPEPALITVGQAADNLAISALATDTLPGQTPQLFAQVQNYGATDQEVALLVRLDGAIWNSVSQTVSAQSQRSFIFRVDEPFETVEAELVLDDATVDYLALDDRAYAVESQGTSRRVLFYSESGNAFLEQVFRSIPGVQVFRGDVNRPQLPNTPYDLYVFDGWLPTALPDADMLIIDPPRSTGLFTRVETSQETDNVVMADRAHPLMRFVNVSGLAVREFDVIRADWADPLIEADGGPLLFGGENDGRRIALFTFNILDSDLALKIAFPLLISNAVEWFAPAQPVRDAGGLRVGEPLLVDPAPEAETVRLTLPDGEVVERPATGELLIFPQTQQAGFYNVAILDNAGTPIDTQTIAINLFSPAESDIAPRASVALGGGVVDAEVEETRSLREFWPVLAGLAILILCYEWYVYYRQGRRPTRSVDFSRSTAARR